MKILSKAVIPWLFHQPSAPSFSPGRTFSSRWKSSVSLGSQHTPQKPTHCFCFQWVSQERMACEEASCRTARQPDWSGSGSPRQSRGTSLPLEHAAGIVKACECTVSWDNMLVQHSINYLPLLVIRCGRPIREILSTQNILRYFINSRLNVNVCDTCLQAVDTFQEVMVGF